MANIIAGLASGEEAITPEELVQAQSQIYKHTMIYIHSLSLKSAVELRIPDTIHNHKKPMPHSDLVNALQIPQSRSTHLYRLMRLLVHNGFFTMQKVVDDCENLQEGYVLTLTTKLLLKGYWNFPAGFSSPEFLKPWESFSEWIKGSDGDTPFEIAHGKRPMDYLVENNEIGNVFNEAMAADSKVTASVFVTQCKAMFEGVTSLVDVGGGIGLMGRAIAEAFPHIKCSVLDLPSVVASCKGTENLEFVGGDMFQAIPSADALLLKMSDEDCTKILKRCREAINSTEKGGKVILMNIMMDNKGTRETVELQLLFDVMLMVNANGKERSEREWETLFKESGFTSYKTTPFSNFRSIVAKYTRKSTQSSRSSSVSESLAGTSLEGTSANEITSMSIRARSMQFNWH
ncbi:hypothetical protein Scep_011458 [Stephania cephalantha]|uniref:O-methyltransferase n=1 Tax=Stephania cephalantha TaxID=152367 RepID=A0AAP0JE67_9MAGN